MLIDDFTKMDVWKKAMDLSVFIHSTTEKFPKEERFALISQMRRASLSVAANIAEGFGRFTAPDKKHKYIQARGELIELITFLHYAERVHYISEDQKSSLLLLCTDVHRMLNALISSIKARIDSPNP